MTTEVAPSCPISYSAYPSKRIPANDPRTPMSRLVDQINRIPRAVDLLSAIHALNIMNNIIMQLTIGEPQVNNVYPLGGGGVILKGEEFGQKYGPEDWILEERNYQKQELVNPDDNDQVIKMRTLKAVYFHHLSAGAHLNYYGQK
jgi:hypothetical protein